MKLKKTAIAVMSVGAAAALSLSVAGAATASPAGHHPKPHSKPKPKPAPVYPQVTGSRLLSGLLPPSTFGDGFGHLQTLSTGGHLQSAKVRLTPAQESCETLELASTFGGYGDTAGAWAGSLNHNDDFSDPSAVFDETQTVQQFATPKAAATFYGQLYSRYGACPSATVNVGDLGGGNEQLTTQSLGKTTVGKYQAFNLIQNDVLSDFQYITLYRSTVVVVAGTNVYLLTETVGTNDPVSADLATKLITKVHALYPKH